MPCARRQIDANLAARVESANAYVANEHCDPVVNAAAEDVGEAFDNRDIYTKGAWMLHTLRNYMGEDAFWAGTRRLIYDTAEPWDLPYPIPFRYRSTDEFIEIMSEEAGEDAVLKDVEDAPARRNGPGSSQNVRSSL